MSQQDPADTATRVADAAAAIRSADGLARNEGVAAAVAIGAPAVPALLQVVEEPGESRAQAMYALATIGDVRAMPAFDRGVRDADEYVRAYAACGLARVGAPEALEALFRTIDDGADPLHLDRTPSVEMIAGTGLRGARALLDLLLHHDELTRLRAQRALEGILARRHGSGREGAPLAEIGQQVARDWHAHGGYAYDADEAHRTAAVNELRRWLESEQEDAWKA